MINCENLGAGVEKISTFFLDSISFMEFLNTGVPHLVLSCENIDSVPLADVGNRLRFHPYYAPEGTNVNFVEQG